MRPTRLLRPIVVLALLALLAAACGGSDGGGAGGGESGEGGGGDGEQALPECPVDALDDADGPVEVVVWHSYIARTADTLVALADQFNASQDDVVVDIQSQGQSYNELVNKYNQAIPTDDLPAIAILEDTQTQYMADSGTVLPAQACFEAAGTDLDQFLPIGVGSYTVDGAMQPGSLNLSTIVLYYNKSHFEQAGLDPEDPPATLDELREAAQAIKDAGAAERPLAFNVNSWFIEHTLTGVGQTLVNENNGRDALATEATLDNEYTLDAMEWIEGMNDDGLMLAVTGDGAVDHYFALGQGTSSMLMETSTAATTIDAVLQGQLDAGDLGVDAEGINPEGLDIGMAPIPGLEQAGKGQVGGGAWYLTGDPTPPEVQAGAWKFVEFMNEVSSQVEWNLDGSYLPWVTDAAEDPALVADWETTRKGQWLAIAYDAVLDLDPDFPGPLVGPYVEMREAIETAIEQVLLDDVDPGDAIATANDEITEALTTYADENF